MIIPITQETLESYVPSFRSSEPYIFDSLQGYILAAREKAAFILGADVETQADGSTVLRPLYVQLICYSAARRAVPGLDLILTENGFGVVSNQNVAPASSSRVEALLESLRKMESDTMDSLVLQLLKTEWKNKPEAKRIMKSLLWSPTLLRYYGITLAGREAYAEEYSTLQPAIEQAEEAVRKVISPELHTELLRRQRTEPSDNTSTYAEVKQKARAYMASLVAAGPAAQPARSELLKERLLRIVEEDADNLPEYKSSATYRAHHFQHYENRREDNTFFFS